MLLHWQSTPSAADCAVDRFAVPGSPGGEGYTTAVYSRVELKTLNTAVPCEASAPTANVEGTECVVIFAAESG